MKEVIFWVWNGPWWTPIVGAFYTAIVLGIALSPIIGAIKAGKR